MGDFGTADRHASEGIARYRPDAHHQLTYDYSGHDPGGLLSRLRRPGALAAGLP